ncbi:MAG TPA: ABC transporter ATP-binding protein [Sphingomicrobium sp.]|nr:ABC transporter ATP-binding protein [Sphingomicrobium sp.]
MDFLPRRRRFQAIALVALMLLGGLAEVFTLAAVFPLLSFMADPNHLQGSDMGRELARFGVDPASLTLPLLAAAFCVVALLAAGVRIVLAWASQSFAFRLAYDMGVGLYDRMLHQPYTFHAQLNSSRIVAAVNNIQRLLTSMFLPLMQGVAAAFLGIFILGGLLLLNPSVALAAMIGFGGIYLIVSLLTRGRLRRNSEAIGNMRRLRIQAVQEGLGGIRDVLIDNTQPVYKRKFAKLDNRLRAAQAGNALIAVTPRFIVEALGMIFIVGIAVVLNAINGTLAGSLPILAVLALGAQRLLPLLQQMYNAWANVIGNRSMFIHIVELLRRQVPPRFADKKITPLVMEKSLTLEKVSFSYFEDTPEVVKDVSLTIPRGSWVGVVGKSGSGKSTLMDLVMGLLWPTGGQISIDGEPLIEDNVRGWQQQIAHVSQAIFLADGTIRENVAFGIPKKSIEEDRVWRACEQAELLEMIEDLPEGLDTQIGERGVRLSGGQRQRIGIARALYKQASVLVLDEATSALDDETEAGIMRSLHRLGRDYTVLMIAHRVTTLRGCDVVYRMEYGRITQQGSYAEVIASSDPVLAVDD